jgi:NAD(P)-dependent dehydrogenase (short-subunit alcohol dehydrogenase family)
MKRPQKLALITGTSSGIGQAAAEAALAAGWQVVGVSRRAAPFASGAYRHFEVDLGDLTGLDKWVVTELTPLLATAPWTRIGLVNNAAMLGSLRSLKEVQPQALARVLAVNAVAPVFLMGWLIRTAPAQTPLRIVNISSGAAVQGIAGLGDYCASKAALRLAGMAQGAELDLGQGWGRAPGTARILSYEPGVVATHMQDAARATDPQDFPSHEVFQEFARRGTLHEPAAVVGEIVAFLDGGAGEAFSERRYGTS